MLVLEDLLKQLYYWFSILGSVQSIWFQCSARSSSQYCLKSGEIDQNLMSCYTFPRASAPILPPLHSTKSPSDILSTNYAIEGRNLSFSVTSRPGMNLQILKNCSIQIPTGQLWMLLGPNGCGKSTLLKILAGLLAPSSGSLYVENPRSFVFQNPDHQVVMPTVESDVAFGLGKLNFTKEEVRTRVRKALDSVGMLPYLQRPVQTLSGGQKQRVAIAGALAETCRVLLLDELTTFLDESDQIGVVKAVKNTLNSSKEVTALWVTHRLEELEYADGAVYMEDGNVVQVGSPSSICNLINKRQALYIEQINS